uniref:transposase n=1 Tax=Robinsoniella peoriensis TaxID=180332 RepID=UPI0037508CD7
MTCLKKIPAIVDKTLITKVCVDDFALRKRYTYGTVMVNLESHRIVDIIESRETKDVENWLKTYPNLQVISRDGAQTYSSSATNSHPDAIQVSDRFYLLINLSEAAEKFMRRLYPSRLVIPSTIQQSEEMQMLYNTRNRSERIHYAQLKRSEGYTITDIALLLHSSTTTINRYLAIPDNEIPESRENVMERKHMGQM